MLALIQKIDADILTFVQSAGPSWQTSALSVSAIIGFSAYIIAGVVVYLLISGRLGHAVRLCAIFALSLCVTYVLKLYIGAGRPFEVDSSVIMYAIETGSGMPSGHALVSIVLSGWLWIQGRKLWDSASNLAVTMVLGAFVFLVGLSRVYLGVHYPSQVIVGWALGAVLLAACAWADARWFSGRNR
jgi:undecaprenyl-diphosphatase